MWLKILSTTSTRAKLCLVLLLPLLLLSQGLQAAVTCYSAPG
jgi:hypothetical protein